MTDEKPLTKQDLLEALKSLATKEDLEILETRLDGKLAAMETRLTKELKEYVHEGVEAVAKALDETATEIKQQMVSQKEFNDLKARMDTHFPLN